MLNIDDIDIVDSEYNNILEIVKDKIRGVESWSNVNLDNNIVDLLLHILTYYLILDIKFFNKMFLDSVPVLSGSERVLYEYSNLIGYTIENCKSSSGFVDFYLDDVNNFDDIIIPYGVEVSMRNIVFTVMGDYKISVGEEGVRCFVVQGRLKSINFISGGSANQIFRIYGRTDLSYIKVYVGDEEWGYVDDLLFSGKTDKNYNVKVFNDYFVIMFGNGVNGKIPLKDEVIRVEYIESLGESGNVYVVGGVNNIVSKIYYKNLDIDGGLIEVKNLKVKNDDIIIGGRGKKELREIRNDIRRYITTNPYLWTKDDYRNYLKMNEKILDVSIYNGWEVSSDILDFFKVYCYIVLRNEEKLTDQLKYEFNDYLNEAKRGLIVRVEFFDVEYIEVLCDIYYRLKKVNYSNIDVVNVVNGMKNTLNNFFSVDKVVEAGGNVIRDIYNSDIVNRILDENIDINSVNVVLRSKELVGVFSDSDVLVNGEFRLSKILKYRNLNFEKNDCYLYNNDIVIGYFNVDKIFNFTNSDYSSKMSVNYNKDIDEVIVTITSDDIKGSYYIVSGCRNGFDLLLGVDKVVFKSEDINYRFSIY